MIKPIFTSVICLGIIFSIQATYAEEELPLPEGKNIKEWESISAALVAEKRISEAVIYLDKILEQEPDNLKALSNKAGLLIQLEKFSESLDISDKVLEIDPNRISTLTNKAIALKMLEEYNRSFEIFTEILDLEPNNEKIKNAQANLLLSTPTVPTKDSRYYVHILVTIRDSNDNLIGVTESTNARFLDSEFTESWWSEIEKKKMISHNNEERKFQNVQTLIPEDDHIGMLTLEKEISGKSIHLFQVFSPLVQLETSDIVYIQWTIIKN